MELRQLRYFSAVATCGNFSRAARQLNLTQPALSRQVKGLEEEIGVKLLRRETNNVSLTAAGELFFGDVHEVLLTIDKAVQRVQGEALNQTLRIGYSPTLTSGFLPQALAGFRATASRPRVELFEMSEQEIVANAKAGKIDVAILTNELGITIPQFQWSDMLRLNPVLVMPAVHPLAAQTQVHPKQLRKQLLYAMSTKRYPECAPRVRAWLKPFGIKPDFARLTADGLASMFTDLEADGAVAILPDGVLNMLPKTLVARPFSPPLGTLVLGVGMTAVRPPAAAKEFVKQLQARSNLAIC